MNITISLHAYIFIANFHRILPNIVQHIGQKLFVVCAVLDAAAIAAISLYIEVTCVARLGLS